MDNRDIPAVEPAVKIVVKVKRVQEAAYMIRREVYTAQFVGGPHDGRRSTGASPEDAIGDLICEVARDLTSADAILEFFASLFADLRYRSVPVALARAVWIAATKRRTAPGVEVDASGAGRRKMPAGKH